MDKFTTLTGRAVSRAVIRNARAACHFPIKRRS